VIVNCKTWSFKEKIGSLSGQILDQLSAQWIRWKKDCSRSFLFVLISASFNSFFFFSKHNFLWRNWDEKRPKFFPILLSWNKIYFFQFLFSAKQYTFVLLKLSKISHQNVWKENQPLCGVKEKEKKGRNWKFYISSILVFILQKKCFYTIIC
jgi:hypothetical protein